MPGIYLSEYLVWFTRCWVMQDFDQWEFCVVSATRNSSWGGLSTVPSFPLPSPPLNSPQSSRVRDCFSLVRLSLEGKGGLFTVYKQMHVLLNFSFFFHSVFHLVFILRIFSIFFNLYCMRDFTYEVSASMWMSVKRSLPLLLCVTWMCSSFTWKEDVCGLCWRREICVMIFW